MRRFGVFLTVVAGFGLTMLGGSQLATKTSAQEAKKQDYALRQAKRELAMLDDIYKTSIVLITTHYVDNKDSIPAGTAFKKLFDAIQAKKWHEVRLIDGTGDPYNPDNEPKEGFEKRAMKKILDGAPQYEEVVSEEGKRFLLAATAIPVVMDKCVICHQVYADAPKGKAIGALGYKIPLQEVAP
ncbi:hypothetical protein VN12_01460 [Pirellula sp. SH-Sr6A]|uniref:c-type heme family protein n=1 Tax=Pirellula sp. SH-Sr6A TaxID=1632865 RepID=UPI00078D9266|nr:DUF3365 domain-containing protein [Pirellula sp. SH-Sr6A]AMV30753.1 hypothetical protein VN12_01460 [Pirellula sp. SH-Sr6A]